MSAGNSMPGTKTHLTDETKQETVTKEAR